MKKLDGTLVAPAARGLSAHEIAALMLLQHAPIAAGMEMLDIMALREAGLADVATNPSGGFQFYLTRKGEVILRMLSSTTSQQDGIGTASRRGTQAEHLRNTG